MRSDQRPSRTPGSRPRHVQRPVRRYRHAARGAALASGLFMFMASPASAQMRVVAGHPGVEVVQKEDGRFIASLKGGAPSSASGVETHEFFDGFELKLQWWTLLGEPIEYYDILWRATDRYEIETEDCPPGVRVGTRCRISRGDLAAYPDLLKRFDALRPTKMYIRVDGSFDGQSHDFSYIVTDPKLLITRSGKMGSGIVPGSPRHWEHFLQYRDYFPMGQGVSARENYGLNGLENATDAAKESRRRVLQRIFQAANGVALTAYITHLEWPEVEMRSIAAKLDRYRQGEEDPPEESPKNGDEEAAADDFWNGEGTTDEEVLLEKSVAEVSGHQYIGEKTVTTKSVTIRCRDHGRVDGDRVRILLNNEVVRSSVTLQGSSTSITVRLKDGVNRLSFEALNTGSVGDNTAEFTVEDADGARLYSNEWSISTGFKGTLLIIRK